MFTTFLENDRTGDPFVAVEEFFEEKFLLRNSEMNTVCLFAIEGNEGENERFDLVLAQARAAGRPILRSDFAATWRQVWDTREGLETLPAGAIVGTIRLRHA